VSEQDIHDVWYEYAVLFVEKKNESEQGWAALTSFTELWDIPKLLSMEQEQQLDVLDEQFWNNEDQIAEKSYGYYYGKLNMVTI